MTPREAILGKIRSQISVGSDDTTRRTAVANRLSSTPKGVIPERGQVAPAECVDLFCQQAEKVHATVDRISTYDGVAEAVSAYLRGRNLPQSVRMGDDNRLEAIDWSKTPNLSRAFGPSDGSDPVGLSHAQMGVAETGTLIMTSGSANPTTVNFLPETHIILVHSQDISGDYETSLNQIRSQFGKGRMPRTVNMITGPSRSADIEQKLLLGAHGPRSLHIIVVDD
ncbi:MAG: lactate utilization protein [Rhizobiaceae bacterium]|nr:lactate utilization protein [Rhizobiaceae bacterium]